MTNDSISTIWNDCWSPFISAKRLIHYYPMAQFHVWFFKIWLLSRHHYAVIHQKHAHQLEASLGRVLTLITTVNLRHKSERGSDQVSKQGEAINAFSSETLRKFQAIIHPLSPSQSEVFECADSTNSWASSRKKKRIS